MIKQGIEWRKIDRQEEFMKFRNKNYRFLNFPLYFKVLSLQVITTFLLVVKSIRINDKKRRIHSAISKFVNLYCYAYVREFTFDRWKAGRGGAVEKSAKCFSSDRSIVPMDICCFTSFFSWDSAKTWEFFFDTQCNQFPDAWLALAPQSSSPPRRWKLWKAVWRKIQERQSSTTYQLQINKQRLL